MTILLFGAEGQLGRELTARAAMLGIPVRAYRRTDADIRKAQTVRETIAATRPTLVVNAAAYTDVDGAETEVKEAFDTNAVGAGIVAGQCAVAKLPFIHISTDYVFDGRKAGAYIEDDPIAPINVYGQSKAAGEQAVRNALEEHVILRTSWLYGIHGRNFLKTIMRLARERDELRVVADQRGCPTGTADLAEGILAIVPQLAAREPIWGTYHLAGSGATTRHGFASAIVDAQAKITGLHPAVIPIATADYPRPAKIPANSELDSSRFAATFRFRASDWLARTKDVTSALLR